LESNADAPVDLHVHSTASDGSLTPIELLDQAIQNGIQALALTDHDTIEGARELFRLPPPSIALISGVEISVQLPRHFALSGGCHLLGYGFDVDDPDLSKALTDFRNIRMERVPRMLNRLAEMDIHLSFEELLTRCGDKPPGRPHIAALMVEKGHAASIDDAFDRYLAAGKPGYVDKDRMDARNAMQLIRHAGGIPVLAHPGLIRTSSLAETDRLIAWFQENGLMGIEVFYPDHDPKQTDHFRSLALRYDLLMTGGTDFHGDIRPDIALGKGRGDFYVPYQIYAELAAACRKMRRTARPHPI